MLDTLLLTLFYLICKAIDHATNANIIHLTLALLTALAAFNIIDGALVPFLNHVMMAFTCLMVCDTVYKAVYQQASNPPAARIAESSVDERWTERAEVQGVVIRKTSNDDGEIPSKQNLNTAIDAIKSRLNVLTPIPSLPGKENTIPIADSKPEANTAERVASLKKALGTGMPGKPLREIDTNSPFHIPARRRSRAQ